MNKQTVQYPESLESVFNSLMEKGHIPLSRKGTCMSSLRKYAGLLGTDIAHCAPELFVKSDTKRNELIESGLVRIQKDRKTGNEQLSLSAVRNVKNDVSFVIRKAIEADLIEDGKVHLASWKESRKVLGVNGNWNLPALREGVVLEKYILDPVPDALSQELEQYRIWTTDDRSPNRPRRLKRRAVTHNTAHFGLLRLAGFLVNNKRYRAECITLTTLTDPNNVLDYCFWFMSARDNKRTATITSVLSWAQTLAQYLAFTTKDPAMENLYLSRIKEMKKLEGELPEEVPVYNKERRWLSMKQIETVGLIFDPYSEERLAQLAPATAARVRSELKRLEKGEGPGTRAHTYKLYALYAAYSLLLRLIVRIPLRQRNLREMSWNPDKPELGENLYKVKGQWRLRFTGEQLKVSRRGGKINAIEYKFPLDLTEALERYLYTWRPLVVAAGTNRHLAPAEHNQFSKNTDQEIVFLTTVGKPFIKDQICMLIQKMTLKYAGVPVNPHMLRTIWATEYIMDNKDPVVAAYMLNDSVKTVMDKYAMLLRPSSADAASEWVTKNLAD